MKTNLTFINNGDQLYDLVKSRKQFNYVCVSRGNLQIFGNMYDYSECCEIVEVQGDVPHECINHIIDEQDALHLFFTMNIYNRLGSVSDKEALSIMMQYSHICYKDDLRLTYMLSYNGEVYVVNEVYVDTRTGNFYDVVVYDPGDDYIYLSYSYELF